ncbi:2-hydroxyglutaryl-CoA dehydratase [Candidatus Dojkabacteria bacterium]|nr:2-hydroxyglutaryl-CoA dehydratase [Candidatus Dojkabacteria bacterium]
MKKYKRYLGIDIGSVSIKYATIETPTENSDKNTDIKVLKHDYFRTHGDIINSLKTLLHKIHPKKIDGIGVTGSGRKFVNAMVSADLSIDEITAHRTAIQTLYPEVKTIFEIGGQDSKLIYFTPNSIGFEMNNVCAAGTGSFLDQQASRLSMTINEFCKNGMTTKDAHQIASKCTVFAETDMIHAQQSGVPINKVIRGVHRGMINNYYSQLCLGKKLESKFLFEGGTSENQILVEEFARKLRKEGFINDESELIVPKPYNKVIGAIGAAIICKNKNINNNRTLPRLSKFEFIESGECYECPNRCGANITKIKVDNKILTIGKSCQS